MMRFSRTVGGKKITALRAILWGIGESVILDAFVPFEPDLTEVRTHIVLFIATPFVMLGVWFTAPKIEGDPE